MKKIDIYTDYITLVQFLKLAGFINNGGEGKSWILEHQILVDGIDEKRRGRKLYESSVIEVNGEIFEIIKKS